MTFMLASYCRLSDTGQKFISTCETLRLVWSVRLWCYDSRMTERAEISHDGNEFTGKRVLVTGGSKGIGDAIVKRLRRGEATVLAAARSDPAESDPKQFIQADVCTRAGTDHIIKATLDLAKRQRTWFRRNKSIHWLTTPVKQREAADLITTFLSKAE